MPFRSKCSGCGQGFTAPDKLAGKTVKCPKCGTNITVPQLAATASQPVPTVPAAKPPQSVPPALAPLTSELDDLLSAAADSTAMSAASKGHKFDPLRPTPLPGDAPVAR